MFCVLGALITDKLFLSSHHRVVIFANKYHVWRIFLQTNWFLIKFNDWIKFSSTVAALGRFHRVAEPVMAYTLLASKNVQWNGKTYWDCCKISILPFCKWWYLNSSSFSDQFVRHTDFLLIVLRCTRWIHHRRRRAHDDSGAKSMC